MNISAAEAEAPDVGTKVDHDRNRSSILQHDESGAEVSPPQQRKLKVRKRRPADMPRHPLSAYNFFFRDERAKILASRAQGPNGTSKEEAKYGLFETMAKTIARRWKNIDPKALRKYQELAVQETKRYQSEMDVYHKRTVGVATDEASTTSKPPVEAVCLKQALTSLDDDSHLSASGRSSSEPLCAGQGMEQPHGHGLEESPVTALCAGRLTDAYGLLQLRPAVRNQQVDDLTWLSMGMAPQAAALSRQLEQEYLNRLLLSHAVQMQWSGLPVGLNAGLAAQCLGLQLSAPLNPWFYPNAPDSHPSRL